MATKKAATNKTPVTKSKTPTQAKSASKKAAQTAQVTNHSIQDLIDAVNDQLGTGVIRRASTMETLYLLRRPTGITTLDLALGGGFAASATHVLVGPDGAGKDYLLWKIAAQQQKIYGDDFCMCVYFTEFKADKPFMRDFCGLEIAFSDEEIAAYEDALVRIGYPPLTDEKKAELKTQTGEILIIDGVSADKAFDAIMKMVSYNKCQMIVINSIGSLQTEAKEDVESFEDHPRQSSEAALISRFIPKLSMTLNNDLHGRNETTLFIVNQMRSKRDAAPVRGRPATERDKYEPGAKIWSLKHGKAIELSLHKGTVYRDSANGEVAGRRIKWEITKGKLGTHDGISGEYDFFYDGGVDLVGDLITACKGEGVLEGTAYVTYEHPELGFKTHGNEALRRHLQTNPELMEHLRLECFKRRGLVYRFK